MVQKCNTGRDQDDEHGDLIEGCYGYYNAKYRM